MKLLSKFDMDNVVKAVAEVSGYPEKGLISSKKHAYVGWVQLGIYAARDMGASIEDASKVFNRLTPTGHVSIKKVAQEVDRGNEEVILLVGRIQDKIRSMREKNNIPVALNDE